MNAFLQSFLCYVLLSFMCVLDLRLENTGRTIIYMVDEVYNASLLTKSMFSSVLISNFFHAFLVKRIGSLMIQQS